MEYLKKSFKFKYGGNKYTENQPKIFKAPKKTRAKDFKGKVKIWPIDTPQRRRE